MMRRSELGGWKIGLVLAALAALVLTGCDAPTRTDRVSPFDRIKIEATIDASGNATVTSTYSLSSNGPEPLRIDAPPGGSIQSLDIDDNPQRAGSATTDVTIDGPNSVVHADLVGVVERTNESASVHLGLWRQTRHAILSDPLIALDLTVHLPSGAEPDGAVRWFGVDGTKQTTRSGELHLTGWVHPQRNATMLFTTSSDAFSPVPATQVVQAGSARTDHVYDSIQRHDALLFAKAAATRRHQDQFAIGYWVLVGLEIAVPLLIAGLGAWRAAARRRRADASAPPTLAEPPGSPSPDLVALIDRGGNDLGAAALAATVLDLIRRDAIELDHATSTQYRIRPAPVEPTGLTDAEHVVLDELTRVALEDTEGWAESPVALVRQGAWWRQYRHDVARRARSQGLVTHRFPRGIFVTSVVALLISTAPLWGSSPVAAAGATIVAMCLVALSALGGFRLSDAGLAARARWRAFGRHLDGNLELGNASAPAVTVWGPHLVGAAALGFAKTAIAELSDDEAPKARPATVVGALIIVLGLAVTLVDSGVAHAADPICPGGLKTDVRAQFTEGSVRRDEAANLDLRCQDLHGMSFIQADLHGLDLSGANLRDAEFGQATMQGTVLTGADLRAASFGQADLTDAVLTGADLRATDFIQTTLVRAVLRDTKARGAKFGQATMTLADLRGIDATEADFGQTTLVRVDASGATFDRASFTQTEIGETDFTGSRLVGAELDVTGASGSVFSRADLTDATSVDTLRSAGADLDQVVGLPRSHAGPWLIAGGVMAVVLALLIVIVLRSRALAQGR